ncbi:MAG: hypothetical protein RL113_1405 [Pseudomonadota bacterium]|jgi:hypothetical protein
MKKLTLFTLLGTFAMAGFFGNEAENQKLKEQQEQERLCSFYESKLDEYAKIKHKDELANATYNSYEKRISNFCSNPAKS